VLCRWVTSMFETNLWHEEHQCNRLIITRQRINSTCTLPLKINLYRLCHKKWRVIKDFSLNRKGPSIRPALINFFRLFMKRAHFFRFCKIINKSDNRYNLSVAYSIVCVGTKSLLLLQSGYFVLSYLPCVCFVDNRKAWIFCAVKSTMIDRRLYIFIYYCRR
jgi:hypothetical protein